ncbi:tRNA (N(6)-L-threonylcarbamoyladenosine(37)-C(2))-methylthiotransferase MtaB [Breznakiella homolactica]|uniref:tRNA (N(6)-L-threonylcarbamoyladenosine(37)-C(2))-methylthiotransferase MtaB n=1 Tax=Breznakiella homolactica TaxID=2798577 RepID=A0A7T7XJV1_9SPIR|nr:tRNA (N(6)-L-threonylcarbamoyladenosine(37)-C(2))-methylthiotransferase MtaB [Breznakiella homolactica]QQO07557.1 tRNA (N(6)-L-threonylcarbamoyladenosine(37)-C(2))-methylthiotransferase MtaB [Breznakiella homolactica]
MISVSFFTLGCKLNQLESESIAAACTEAGCTLLPWGSGAHINIINTCTVTSKAEQKARRVIRKILKENPASRVIVTGCYAQLDGASIRSLADERLLVIPGGRKSILLDLPAYIRDWGNSPDKLSLILNDWLASSLEPPREDAFRFNAEDFSFHSRASLKIQDGCSNACAYCRVRLARGGSISLDAGEALRRLRILEERGYAEAVLTGININQYRSGGLLLPGLIEYLIGNTERIALRISSTEINGVTPDFIRAIAHPRVQPHFHLSVQSGNGDVLRRMRRSYGPEDIRRTAEQIRAVKDDPFIACDIICGFPGEGEAEFRDTYELCEELDFSWIHAFPYSPRPGTEAYEFTDSVPEKTASERVSRLIALGSKGRKDYIRRSAGRVTGAIIEKGASPGPNQCSGITDNYLRVLLATDESPPPGGTRVLCRIAGPWKGAAGGAGDRIDARAVLLP